MDNDPAPNSQEFSDDELKAILKEALTFKLKEKRKIPRKNELNKALINTMGEFLTCFRVMGYDYDGNPLIMTVYREKLEKAALDNMFMEEIGKFVSSR